MTLPFPGPHREGISLLVTSWGFPVVTCWFLRGRLINQEFQVRRGHGISRAVRLEGRGGGSKDVSPCLSVLRPGTQAPIPSRRPSGPFHSRTWWRPPCSDTSPWRVQSLDFELERTFMLISFCALTHTHPSRPSHAHDSVGVCPI